MAATAPRFRRPAPRPRGAVLIVALIVLVALALGALSLLRSVDVLGLISGNLSFKRSAIAAADRGVDRALTTFLTVANQTATDLTLCYSATVLATDTRGVPTALNDKTAFDAAYGDACTFDAGQGEEVRFVIDRQCTAAGYVDPKKCTLSIRPPSSTDNWDNTASIDYALYRVTVRVSGPRNTESFTQVVFKPPV
jgi:type IV pilus assembly protein PilX